MELNEKNCKRVDSDFKHSLAKFYGGDTLKYCYQCGNCTATCPLARVLGVYRPNKILESARLGIRSTPVSAAFIMCSACTLCTKGCPQNVKVHELMHGLKEIALKDSNVREYLADCLGGLLDTLSEEMPFPASYAWICLPEHDEKGFYGSARETVRKSASAKLKAKKAAAAKDAPKVAVIGSGPCGLTAAWALRKAGFRVTVFESLPEAGGMLTAGIPSYRLPNEIVAAEVAKIKKAGVVIKTNAKVTNALFKRLASGKEYAAVFVAGGAAANRLLHIEGASLAGVIPALELLRQYNLKEELNVGKNVVVIGGGNVGIDAARTALRCGAEKVQIFCLEAREEMPAHEWEIREAVNEGVILNPSWGPKIIKGSDCYDSSNTCTISGGARYVDFLRCKSVFDASGKFNPVYDEKTAQTVDADTVILAIGQYPELGFLGSAVETARGAVSVDPRTMETNIPGVFAGGDAVSGTASLIEAVIAGKTAAASIIEYLKKG